MRSDIDTAHGGDESKVVPHATPATEGTLKRNIGPIGIIGLGLSIVNGWVAMSSTIVIGLGQGGTPVILYGLIGTSLINALVISTIAELAAAYPTAGGQYVWSAILSGSHRGTAEGRKPSRHPWSFVVGWATIYEWIVIVAAVSIICAQTVFGLVQTFHPDFEIQRWQVFLIFELVNTNSMIANIFFVNRMPNLGTFFLFLSNIAYVAIIITCPATAKTHQSSAVVWKGWQNDIGWDNKFVVAATGLVNPGK